jgi:hypothetical protein
MLHVEHTRLLLSYPLFLRQRLTLWTMTIAARVVRWTLVIAIRTPIEMPTQDGCAALRDIGEHTLLLGAKRVLRFERRAMASNDVRDVEAPSPFEARHAPTNAFAATNRLG